MPTVEAESVPFLSREEVERRSGELLRDERMRNCKASAPRGSRTAFGRIAPAARLLAVPVDPVVSADRLGIAVHNAKFWDGSIVGMIAKQGGNVTMLVNAADSPFRKRFTIAHELGHHFLHLLEDGDFVDGDVNLFRGAAEDQKESTPERRREIQANMFAAALLMPQAAVQAEWKKLRSVDGMARRFNVSEASMGIRVVQLGLA